MAERYANLIGGQWRQGERFHENRNPSDVGDLIGLYAQAGAADVEDAVAAGRAAMPAWRATWLEQR